MTFRTILCPVDFSPQSRLALRVADAFARRFGGRITVMFVNDPILLAAAKAAHKGRREFVDRTSAELSRFVSRALRAGEELEERIELTVRVGNPAGEVIREAKRRRADLIVMGSHGLSGIQKAFFGSTTEQVLRSAHVPVLAIPPSLVGRRKDKTAADFAHVITPIDLAGEWETDAVRAAMLAGELDATLTLVHVLAPVQAPPWLPSTIRSNDGRRVDKARTALERVRRKLFADVRSVTTHVVVGEPANEIARLTNRAGSLVVMSLRGTSGVWGLRRGAIAYRVLSRSSTPVLALPRRRIGGRFSARARKAVTDALTERDRMEIAGIEALLSLGSRAKRVKR